MLETVGTGTNGVTTRFSYDGDSLIAEYDGSNTLLRRYVHGPGADAPLVWYEGTGLTDRRWLIPDERGSIVAVTDGAGAAIAVNSYDAYGIPALTNLGRFQYTGQTWIPELGMYNYKARIYSATLGRFMQTDPIGYGDGMNMYAYVGGDPVNFTDPSGLRGNALACSIAGRACIDGVGEPSGEEPPIVVTAPKYSRGGGTGLLSVRGAPIIRPPSGGPGGGGDVSPKIVDTATPQKNCPAPPTPGAGRSAIDQNIAQAKRQSDRIANNPAAIDHLANLVDQSLEVTNSRSQNYKMNPKYGNDAAPFGNFNFGATMQARGFSLTMTRWYSNAFQRVTTGRADPVEDARAVEDGYTYAQNRCNRP